MLCGFTTSLMLAGASDTEIGPVLRLKVSFVCRHGFSKNVTEGA